MLYFWKLACFFVCTRLVIFLKFFSEVPYCIQVKVRKFSMPTSSRTRVYDMQCQFYSRIAVWRLSEAFFYFFPQNVLLKFQSFLTHAIPFYLLTRSFWFYRCAGLSCFPMRCVLISVLINVHFCGVFFFSFFFNQHLSLKLDCRCQSCVLGPLTTFPFFVSRYGLH